MASYAARVLATAALLGAAFPSAAPAWTTRTDAGGFLGLCGDRLVSLDGARRMSVLAPTDGAVLRRVTFASGYPIALDCGARSAYVLWRDRSLGTSLLVVDPLGERPTLRVARLAGATDLTVAGGVAWVRTSGRRLIRVDADGQMTELRVRGWPLDIAASDRRLWVIYGGGRRGVVVEARNAAGGRLIARRRLRRSVLLPPQAIESAAGAAVVDNMLLRVRGRTILSQALALTGRRVQSAASANRVIVVDACGEGCSQRVVSVDARSGASRRIATVRFGWQAYAASDNAVYLSAPGRVTRR